MNKLTFLGFALMTSLLIGCGGGSSSGGDTSGGSSPGTTITIESPITSQDLEITNYLGLKEKAGFDGNIEIVKKTQAYDGGSFEYFEYKLNDSLSHLNVTDVVRVDNTSFSCPDSNTYLKGNGSGKVTYNYKEGTVKQEAAANGYTIGCTYSITPFAGETVSDNDSIWELLEDWGDTYDVDFISTTGTGCPVAGDNDDSDDSSAPSDAELEQMGREYASCTFNLVKNITVKDDAGETHKVSKSGSLPLELLLLLLVPAFLRFRNRK